jgi:hypothetical protein
MTCSRCGARETVQRTNYCARCLLPAIDADADAAISGGADEAPPCELLSILGDSPRAMTFLGEQTWPIRRLVALKLFKDARLWHRGTAPPPPRHPTIAPVLETGLLGGLRYVMTAYFSGGTLPTCYDRHRLGAGARMDALVAVADALVLAHARGTVHGRLSASNLLCEAHSPFAVRIVDFDLALRASSDEELEALKRADLAGVVRVAEDLLRSPIAQVSAAIDLATEFGQVTAARQAADMCRALKGLAARLEPR